MTPDGALQSTDEDRNGGAVDEMSVHVVRDDGNPDDPVAAGR